MNESKKLIQIYAYFYSCCITTSMFLVVVLSIIRQLSNLLRMNFITKINRGDSWIISQITLMKISISHFNKKVTGVAVNLGNRSRFIMTGHVVTLLFQEGHLNLPVSILQGFWMCSLLVLLTLGFVCTCYFWGFFFNSLTLNYSLTVKKVSLKEKTKSGQFEMSHFYFDVGVLCFRSLAVAVIWII